MIEKGIQWGKPTERERNLMLYIGECIAQWLEKNKTDRSELICAFSAICAVIFTKDTPLKNIEDQCKEIDSFCHFLKLKAKGIENE